MSQGQGVAELREQEEPDDARQGEAPITPPVQADQTTDY